MPLRKKGHSVGGQARETHFVRDENEVGALFAKLLNHVEDLGGHLRVERGCRLIEEDDPRLDCDGASNGDALTLTAGKGRRLFVRVSFELKAAKQLESNVTHGAAITQQGRFVELYHFAVELDASVIRNLESGQNSQERSLAAAGGADQDEAVRLFQVERYRIERRMRIEAFG